MISLGYYIITLITMALYQVREPMLAQTLGLIVDLEIMAFLTFTYYYFHLRPRRSRKMNQPESQSEGAIMQTRAGCSCTEPHPDTCQCKKDKYTI